MKKRILEISLTTITLLALILAPAGLAAAKNQNYLTMQGKIVSINAKKQTITIKVRRRRKILQITDTSRLFTITDRTIARVSRDVFKKGDRITAVTKKYPKKRGSYEVFILVRNKAAKTSASATAKASSSPTSAPPAPALPSSISESACNPLPAPTGKIVTVSSETELRNAISNKASNLQILVKDGTYDLSNGFWIDGSNVTIRSESGNRDSVVLRGKGMNGGVSHIFWFAGSNITVADMTIGWVANHPIQVFGESGSSNHLIHNLRIADSGEQLLKVSFNAAQLDKFSDNGVIECSLFEFTAGEGPQWYIGGIDAHHSRNWIIRNNVFKNIKAPRQAYASNGPSEHAVHFWSDSENTLVEGNTIINSDRGIGFGLGDAGHKGGIIGNNMIYHDSSQGDVGIGLENAKNVQVIGNTIFFENNYPNAIEYRFENSTGIRIENNTTNKSITARDNGQATLLNNTITNNVEPFWRVYE